MATNKVADIVLRRATLEDARTIAHLRIESWRQAFRGIVPDTYLDGMNPLDAADLWQRVLGAQSETTMVVYVAEIEGNMAGFAAGHALAEPKFGLDAELTAVYLLPPAQRQGLGTRLVRLVAQALADAGHHGLLAWTLSKNKPSREFFAFLGGEELLEQDYHWDDLEMKEIGYGWRDLPALAKA